MYYTLNIFKKYDAYIPSVFLQGFSRLQPSPSKSCMGFFMLTHPFQYPVTHPKVFDPYMNTQQENQVYLILPGIVWIELYLISTAYMPEIRMHLAASAHQ